MMKKRKSMKPEPPNTINDYDDNDDFNCNTL